jgi:hypothetical protein
VKFVAAMFEDAGLRTVLLRASGRQVFEQAAIGWPARCRSSAEETFLELCERFGISRKQGDECKARYELGGV